MNAAEITIVVDGVPHRVRSDVSTEDLRLALRQYRSFFDRLIAV